MPTSMMPTSNTHRRLSIAKEMYLSGVYHSRKNFMTDSIHSILEYDFSIEMIIKTILQDSGVSLYNGSGSRRRPKNFHNLTTDLLSNFVSLRYVSDIRDLHDLRNSVQHRGIVPSTYDVQRFTTIVRMFFDEICTVCYSNHINFGGVSLSIFIPSVVERVILENLERALQERRYDDALVYARKSLSYHKLLLARNMREPYRWSSYTNSGFNNLDSHISEIDAHIIWLTDHALLSEYYLDVQNVFGERWTGGFGRETTTQDEAENARTISYNFILGTQRYIQVADTRAPFIFDIFAKDIRNDGCDFEIGYAAHDSIQSAVLEIRITGNVIQQHNLPNSNGLHEFSVIGLNGSTRYFIALTIKSASDISGYASSSFITL